MLFRYFADLSGSPVDAHSMATTNRAIGLHDPGDVVVFNADVTTPDQTVVLPGETFQKTWEIQNVGTRAWRGRRWYESTVNTSSPVERLQARPWKW